MGRPEAWLYGIDFLIRGGYVVKPGELLATNANEILLPWQCVL